MVALEDDDDVELVPIPMNAHTRRLLKAYAKACGKRETETAGELLELLMNDQSFWEAAADEAVSNHLQ